jgi:hypothetical protein
MPVFAYAHITHAAMLALAAGLVWLATRRTLALSAFRAAELLLAFAFLIGGQPHSDRSGFFPALFLPGVLLCVHAVTPAFWRVNGRDC